jgi:hypothetical protein
MLVVTNLKKQDVANIAFQILSLTCSLDKIKIAKQINLFNK